MDDSPFCKLPPELRNLIYKLSFSEDETIILQAPPSGSSQSLTIRRDPIDGHRIPKGLALTRTCKQIRAESTAFFYANNNFEVPHHFGPLRIFCQMIGKHNTSALRSITISEFAGFNAHVAYPELASYPYHRHVSLEFRKLAKRYVLRSARLGIRLFQNCAAMDVWINVGDLNEPLERVTEGARRRYSDSWKSRNELEEMFILKLDRELGAWQEMLKKAERTGD